ncbi:hypothetical protein BJ742DRAFT_738070 [Cladochytrium replicatum]|nr:hypothetical protein BJ742DRAFT_738070 [Cladochytrium replicatum]
MPPALPAPVLTFAIDNLSKLDSLNHDDISAIWGVFTKCKDNLENGRRLENLSWRLWYRSVHLSNITTTPANLSLSNTTVVPFNNTHSCSVSPSSVNKILASFEISSLTASVDPAASTTANVVVSVFEPDARPTPVTITPPPLLTPSGSTASSSSGSSTTLLLPSALRRTPRMTALADDENVVTPEPLRTSPNRPAPIMRVEFDAAHSPAHSPGSPSRDQRKVKFYISESSSDDGGRRAAAQAMMEAGRNAPPTQEQIQLQQQRQHQQNVLHQQQQNILLLQQQQILQRQHQQQQMQQQWYPHQNHQQPPMYPQQQQQQHQPQAPVYESNVAFVPVAPVPQQPPQPILPPEYIAQLNPAQRQLLMSHLQKLPALNATQQHALARLQMYQQPPQPPQPPRATFSYEDDDDSEFDNSDSEFDSEFSDSENGSDVLSPRARPDPMFAKLTLAALNSPPSTTALVRNRSALSLALRSNSGILPPQPPALMQQQVQMGPATKALVGRDDFRRMEMSESMKENLAWDRRAMFGARVGRGESVEDIGEWEEQLDGEEIW